MDAKREALAQARYSVLDESGVLRREVSALDLATAALGYDSLLHRQMVIFGRREEFAVQLPAVDHLKKNPPVKEMPVSLELTCIHLEVKYVTYRDKPSIFAGNVDVEQFNLDLPLGISNEEKTASCAWRHFIFRARLVVEVAIF